MQQVKYIIAATLTLIPAAFNIVTADLYAAISEGETDTSIIESDSIMKCPRTKCISLSAAYQFSGDDLQTYNRWVANTVEQSRHNNSFAIIIDKSAYTLYLIENGKLHSKYPIELGGNPYDDKQRRGDQCTPEGMYEVSWKRDKGQTVFYRAFLLNYPNFDDKRNGKTGSHIEIHGEGTGEAGNKGGYNWTLGCIAMSNADIDRIFPFLQEGSPVTIVKYTNIDLTALDAHTPSITFGNGAAPHHPAIKVAQYVSRNFEDTDEFMGLHSYYKTLISADSLTKYLLEIITEKNIVVCIGLNAYNLHPEGDLEYLAITDGGMDGLKSQYLGYGKIQDRFRLDKGQPHAAINVSEAALEIAKFRYSECLTDILTLIED
jgi:hypothetical protein